MAIIKRVQYIEIPDEEWDEINWDEINNAPVLRTEESKCAEACMSINAIIVDEEHYLMEE